MTTNSLMDFIPCTNSGNGGNHDAGKTSDGLSAKTKTVPQSVSGNVKDSDSSNLAGAKVKLVPSDPLLEATMDADGNYTFSSVPEGIYSIVVTKGTAPYPITTNTDSVSVAGAPVSGKNMQFMSGDLNTVVKSKPGTPEVAVGGMNNMLNTENLGETLTGEEPAAAAICGLFCGTCPSYADEGEGCLSSRVAPGCDMCGNGFRECAKLHKVTRCHECGEFPCPGLQAFSKRHVVNGICHHEQVIENLKAMRESGVEEWVRQQEQERSCPICGRLIPWFERGCTVCASK